MKGKQYFLFATLLGALLLLLAACGNSTSGQTSSSSGQTGSQQTSGPSIVGMWTGDCNLSSSGFKQAEFDADGTLVLDNFVAKYEISGDKVQFIAPQTTLQYTYSVSADGNILSLSDSSGGFCSVGRVGTDAVQEAAQSLIAVWTGSCRENLASFGSTFSKLEFRSDGTAVFDDDTASPEQYKVPDAGHVVFPNMGVDQAVTWSFMASGSTLTITAYWVTGPATCSLQKSA